MGLVSTYKIQERNRVLISLVAGIVYAASDEIHQAFIPRKSSYDNRCYDRWNGRIIRNISSFVRNKNIYEKNDIKILKNKYCSDRI